VAMEALEPLGRKVLREQIQLEVLKNTEADIHFFQEVNPVATRSQQLATSVDAIFQSQGDLAGLKLFGLGFPFNLNSGLVTAVRRKWGMRPVGAISLSRPGLNLVRSWASWQLKEERFALLSETLLPGWGKVLLVNAHIHHGLEATDKLVEQLRQLSDELGLPASAVSELKERLNKGNKRRAQEMDVLFEAIDSLGERYEGVVVAGDFNSRPESEVAARFAASGFRDAWSEANGDDPGFTFDSSRNAANHLMQKNFPLTLVVEDLSFSVKVKDSLLDLARVHEAAPRRIDYIYFRSKSVKLKVNSASLVGVPSSGDLAPSDHFGVCADIVVVD
jgi:endonuclease/exonuclease/phosphatase family metal-dependent hydrolase